MIREDGILNASLIEHLTDLRKRLVNSMWFVLIGFVACWNFTEQIFEYIRKPIQPYLPPGTTGLIFTAPMDKFMSYLKVSFLAGFVISSPLWLYQVWAFIAPGLYRKERTAATIFIISGTGLFLCGVAFVYLLVLPMAFEFLLNFGGQVDTPMITISEYLSFFTTMVVVFGIAFELPLVLSVLGYLGVIDSHFLVKYRRFAVVALAAFSAVITPPDALSMIMMLVPLLFLYELSIILVRIIAKKRAAERAV